MKGGGSFKLASKMKITPFKPQVLMDKKAAENTWEQLAHSFDEMYNRNTSHLLYEQVYRLSYNMVLQKHGDLLYEKVNSTFKRYSKISLDAILSEPDQNLLYALFKAWEEHRTTILMIRDVVMYMDKTHIVHKKLVPVFDMGVIIFRDIIVYHPSIRQRLQRMLLENILNERNGEVVDVHLLKGVLSMLIELGLDGEKVYEKEFESAFLSTTRTFYREESLLFISQNTCPDYVKKVEGRLSQENKRMMSYLAKTTESKLKKIIEAELITAHAQTLVDMEYSGCESMFKETRKEDLTSLFRLLSRVPRCVDLLRDALSAFVRDAGLDILQNHDKSKDPPVVFAQKILDLKAKFDGLVSVCFDNDTKSKKMMKEAFEEFMNKDNRAAAYLAMYVDDLMKTGLKGVSEPEAEEKLDQIILVFQHLQDKDVFESYYKNYLAKRLLSSKGVQDEMERIMLSKLKSECGYQFTSKMEGMFTDMKISRGVNDSYRAQQSETTRAYQVDFEVNVLTAGFWPSVLSNDVKLPDMVLRTCVTPFCDYYMSNNSNRKLTWQYHLGNADLRVSFADSRRELNVSTYQMCILMLFNTTDTLSLGDIRHATGIPEADLRRHLLSLCTPKFRILNKSSTAKGIANDEVFTFNMSYTSKLRRVKIPLVVVKGDSNGAGNSELMGGVEGLGAVPANVEEDRRHMLEATIVRIMKARKTMAHNDLVAETMRQCTHRFTPNSQTLKKRIESLIEREYLQRDSADRKKYNYLA